MDGGPRRPPPGPLFCVIDGPTRGRAWSATAARAELRHLAAQHRPRDRRATPYLRSHGWGRSHQQSEPVNSRSGDDLPPTELTAAPTDRGCYPRSQAWLLRLSQPNATERRAGRRRLPRSDRCGCLSGAGRGLLLARVTIDGHDAALNGEGVLESAQGRDATLCGSSTLPSTAACRCSLVSPPMAVPCVSRRRPPSSSCRT
jgi:hypothetical protein